MKSRFSLILIACVVIFGGILFVTKKDSKTASSSNAQPTNHVRGATNSKVTFVEYGDFQCPACEAYYPLVEQAFDKYKTEVTFQFRNFPLSSKHQHALAAHRVVEAASKQGKFWEMYKLLYDGQPTWSPSSGAALSSDQVSKIFEGYAQQLGLNMTQFDTDRNGSEVNDIIQADVKAGNEAPDGGVTGTPTFYINGKKIDTSTVRSQDDFNKFIEDAIKANK